MLELLQSCIGKSDEMPASFIDWCEIYDTSLNRKTLKIFSYNVIILPFEFSEVFSCSERERLSSLKS